MKKILPLLIGLFVVINICLGSIAGINLNNDANSEPRSARKTADEQTSPDIYDPGNVFYACSPTIRSTIKFLKGVPLISDGSEEEFNLAELINGATMPFKWPAQGRKAATLKKTSSEQPFISLVLNSLGAASKNIVVAVGIDANNHYDPHIPSTLEHRCEFPAYQTTSGVTQQSPTMEEEVYEAYGTWQGTPPGTTITKGRVVLEVTMTSPNGDPALIYCGFNFKSSWIFFPYAHTDLVPRAKLNATYQNQGFPPADKIMVGDRIYYDGSDSYDPNDDLNGNERIDSGEIDRLKYKWDWGDGSATNFAFDNKRTSHIYSSDDIPLTVEYKDFMINLTVMDNEGHTDFNSTMVRIYRGDHSPVITSLKIKNYEQLTQFPKQVVSVLDKNVNVFFSAIATDQDKDDLIYYWDFDGDTTEYEIIGNEVSASVVSYIFAEPQYTEGKHKITLVVSDGTLADNATATCQITLKKNVFPVAKIKARREFDSDYYNGNITVKINQIITFYASDSYDPDNLTGFDTNNDNETDYQLKYRWNFNIIDPSATSGWITSSSYVYSYLSAGNFKYFVTLDVDDGVNITTSEVFTVNINVRPNAKISIDPESYNFQGNFEIGTPIIFNGSSSNDPNGDIITSYKWEIGSGDNAIIKTGKIMNYNFSEWGTHLVNLKVYDGEFWSESYQVKVEIPEPTKPPLPKYSANPLQVFAGKSVDFDASNTTDLDSQQRDLKFIWNYGDNSSLYISRENVTTHKYKSPGQYRVTLTVEDETGNLANISTIIITVKNNPPVARIRDINDVKAGREIQLSGVESSDKDGRIVIYIWNFGDGSEVIETNESQVKHRFNKRGTFTIELTVQDDQGGTDETQMQLRVIESGSESSDVEFTTTLIVGAIITVIIVIIVIVIILMLYRSKERI